MYAFIGISALKQIRPYFRKYISDTLESHEYMFVNALFILIILLLYKFVLSVREKQPFTEMFQNYRNLNGLQLGCLFVLALLAVCSTMTVFHLDKYYNTPLINSLYMHSFEIIMLFLVGIYLFREKYSVKDMFGIVLIAIGIYIVTYKKG
jgi:drug/metabolite transporter (DMT)-like permease